MKLTASDFRYCNVLPSRMIELVFGRPIRAIRFLAGFNRSDKWYEYEKFVELDFVNADGDEKDRIGETCRACGLCCKNIPGHQIAIYASPSESVRMLERFPGRKMFQGVILSDGVLFNVLDVKENGDCTMLGPTGCELGDDKPLWCKIYHCEKYQGKPYLFEEKK